MALHAVDDLADAFAATRAFLLPFEPGTWLRLALVVFFLGGVGGNVPSSGTQFGGETVDPGGIDTTFPDLTGQILALVLVVAAVMVALGLLFGFVGSVMEFVLVRSLREEEVHVRRYFGEHWRAGARLFGFRIALALLAAALVVLPVLALVFGTGGPGSLGLGGVFGLVLLLIPLAVVVGLGFSLVHGFTTFFVVPVMLLENEGVLASWRRFYRTLRSAWKEYLAFAVLTFVLTIVLGTAVGFVVGIVALLVLGPIVLFGLVGAVTSGVFGPGAGAASLLVLVGVGVVALLALLLVLFVAALVRVPVVTYLRYYALLVLGDTDTDLDVVPERRRTIRAGNGTDPPSG